MNTGFLVTIEGVEGSGKSTLLQGLKQALVTEAIDIVYTREPGGTDLSENIRQLLIQKTQTPMHALTELLMVYAARQEHISKFIMPNLVAGRVVISDRFVDASYAYQAGGRGLAESKLKVLDEWVVKNCMPKLTILLKAPLSLCLERVDARGEKDRFDSEKETFFERVDQMYARRMLADPDRFLLIDSQMSKDQAVAMAVSAVKSLIASHLQEKSKSLTGSNEYMTSSE